jgi:dienelactone hydrolase
MKNETVEYKDGDVSLRGYLAYDESKSGKRPGILVMPEAFGLGAQAKRRCDMLAQLGYVALGGDPYGNGEEFTDLQAAIKRATPMFGDPAMLRKRGHANLNKLASLPNVDTSRLAAMGYCMGGTFSLELARDGAPLRGIVSFHGGLQTMRPAEAGKVKARLLVCHGAADSLIPAAQVAGFMDEMTKAGADWQMNTYGGAKHSFTNPESDKVGMPGIGYQKEADQRSWEAMKSFFHEIFGA